MGKDIINFDELKEKDDSSIRSNETEGTDEILNPSSEEESASENGKMKVVYNGSEIVFENPNGEFDRDLIISSGAQVLNSKNVPDEEKQKWRTKLCSMFRLSTDSFNESTNAEKGMEDIANEMEANIEKQSAVSGVLKSLDEKKTHPVDDDDADNIIDADIGGSFF